MACRELEEFIKSTATLCRSTRDDQPVYRVIGRERSGGIDAAVFRIRLAYRLNRLRIDPFRLQHFVRPTGDDMGNKPFPMLPRGFAIAADRRVDQHGFS